MRVISTPSGLRWAASLPLLAAPLAGLQLLLASRIPLERLPLKKVEIAAAAILGVTALLGYLMSRGRRLARSFLAVIALAWCAANAWVAVRTKNPALGFFTAFLFLFWLVALAWLRLEMMRSFFDPRIRWYVGLPKPISGLKCELAQGQTKADLIVGRFDRDGAFVFSPAGRAMPELKTRDADLTFYFRDRRVKCRARAIRALQRGEGVGFQFQGLSADGRKDLGDFLEALRGEGHADE